MYLTSDKSKRGRCSAVYTFLFKCVVMLAFVFVHMAVCRAEPALQIHVVLGVDLDVAETETEMEGKLQAL